MSIELAGIGGEVLVFGTIAGGDKGLPYYQMYAKELTLYNPRAALLDDYATAVGLAAAGRVDLEPIVTHTVALDDVAGRLRFGGRPRFAQGPAPTPMTPELTIKGGSVVTPEGVMTVDLASSDGVITAVGQLEGRGRVVDATRSVGAPRDGGHPCPSDGPRPDRARGLPHRHQGGRRQGGDHRRRTHPCPTGPEPVGPGGQAGSPRRPVERRLSGWPPTSGRRTSRGIPELWRAGVVFFKLFTCTTHGVPGLSAAELLGALTALAEVDGRALVHCEDETMTAMAEWALRQAGRHDPGLLIEWRSREAELSAVTMVGALAAATGAAVTFAHVSSGEAVTAVQTTRSWGANVAAEACPQYLALDESEVMRPGATPQIHSTGAQPQRRRARRYVAVAAQRVAHPRRHRSCPLHPRAEAGGGHLGGTVRATRPRHHLPVHGRCRAARRAHPRGGRPLLR